MSTGSVWASELIFFTHPGVEDSSLTGNGVKDIYLKKRRFWSDSLKIRPIDYSIGQVPRQKFIEQVLKMKEVEITEYWIQEKQSTGSVQPLQVPSVEMMLYLSETMPGSLGYVLSTSENLQLLRQRKLKVIQNENQ